MGEFITLASVATMDRERVLATLADEDLELVPNQVGYPVLRSKSNDMPADWSFLASLSADLCVPTIELGIYDGDYWYYELYSQGKLVDRFRTLPCYFAEECPDDYKGNPETVTSHWPGVSVGAIRRYYGDRLRTPSRKQDKPAYIRDRFQASDVWELIDFMAKLNIRYPDDDGSPPSFRERIRNLVAFLFLDLGFTTLSDVVRKRLLKIIIERAGFASPDQIERAFWDYPTSEWQALLILLKEQVPFLDAHANKDYYSAFSCLVDDLDPNQYQEFLKAAQEMK